MSELCTDNRFELIEKYKAKLIEATNIETDTLGMAAIDSILFRFWQMGWLDKLNADAEPVVRCGNCAKRGKNGKDISGGCPFEMTDDTCDPNAYCSYGVLSL